MPQVHTAALQWLVSRLIDICEVKQHRGYSMKGWPSLHTYGQIWTVWASGRLLQGGVNLTSNLTQS